VASAASGAATAAPVGERCAVADAIFEDPRLARLYDPLDPDRRDLDAYVAVAAELRARSVLDVGCGTGSLACRLARRGIEVIGVDPAGASLDVARAKPGADRVRFIQGDATTLPPLRVDMALMTGNVAQVFVTDEAWTATLHGVKDALRRGGWLVFETRVPAQRAWEGWTPQATLTRVHVDGVGTVELWHELQDVSGELVTFRSIVQWDDVQVESRSTLRFRGREAIERSVQDAGYVVHEVRDAPDRPGLEHVFVTSVR
jgi:SAM-dependent methyltransferase